MSQTRLTHKGLSPTPRKVLIRIISFVFPTLREAHPRVPKTASSPRGKHLLAFRNPLCF